MTAEPKGQRKLTIPKLERSFSGADERFFLNVDPIELISGEMCFLVGPNGSGKTLYLRSLAAENIEGATLVNRAYYESLQEYLTVYARQNPIDNLAESLTAEENLSLWHPKKTLRQNLDPLAYLDAVKNDAEKLLPALASTWKSDCSQMSGGQRQALSVYARLLAEPRLLLLDEITASIDAVSAKALMDFISDWVSSRDIFCVVVSHDITQISSYADRVIVLNRGRTFRTIEASSAEKISTEGVAGALKAAWENQ